MKLFVFVALCLQVALAARCSSKNCLIEDGCVCSSVISPLDKEDTPQLVLLSFDDSGRADIYSNYYDPLLFNRKNPDGKPVGATFFIPHEYTDYSVVNKLYNRGFDIGLHSITKRDADFWINADLEELIEEFKGQKLIVHNHANIPNEDIRGARIPHIQLAGDALFEAYRESELTYDGSWTSLSKNRYFPYSLDYESTQQCLIGTCPTASFPNQWVVPINNIRGNEGIDCNALFGCQMTGSPEEISAWLMEQFNVFYNDNRAPFSLLVNFSWLSNEDNFLGLQAFLDRLGEMSDVFLVTEWDAIQWRKNPVPVSEYQTTKDERNAPCNARNCELKKGDEIRYMMTCTTCPEVYPWIGNPEGNGE